MLKPGALPEAGKECAFGASWVVPVELADAPGKIPGFFAALRMTGVWNELGDGGEWRVYVPQPSGDQAPSGWGTLGFGVGGGEQATAGTKADSSAALRNDK
jgi:hypothetical protein